MPAQVLCCNDKPGCPAEHKRPLVKSKTQSTLADNNNGEKDHKVEEVMIGEKNEKIKVKKTISKAKDTNPCDDEPRPKNDPEPSSVNPKSESRTRGKSKENMEYMG